MEIHITQGDIDRANDMRRQHEVSPKNQLSYMFSDSCPVALAAKRELLTNCGVDGETLEVIKDGTIYSLCDVAREFVYEWDNYWDRHSSFTVCPGPCTFTMSKWY